jgi:hypothetical protein
VGKSRATVALAQAGATGESWFALPVRHRFKTMIVQNENGSFRLRQEFANLEGPKLDDWIRVSRPPRAGLCFDRVEFRTALARSIAKFQPGLVILDPWNAVARDEKARDYLETFEAIREVIPTGDQSPALGIVAHTRKPKTDERPSGRALLHEIAGSHVIGSLPRCAFVMQSASDDSAESRVVWSNCKNNDGSLAPRSAWERRNGLFSPVIDFDWDSFDTPRKPSRSAISVDDIRRVFDGGRELTRPQLRDALMDTTGRERSQAYDAISKFRDHLVETGGKFRWKG